MKIVPIDACIKRFYRGYVEVKDDATNEEIRAAAEESILQNITNAFDLDPDMDIEEDDIVFISPDEEGSWTEEEDEEITRILSDDLMSELERGVDTVCEECCFISETNCAACPVRRSLDIHKENRKNEEV